MSCRKKKTCSLNQQGFKRNNENCKEHLLTFKYASSTKEGYSDSETQQSEYFSLC